MLSGHMNAGLPDPFLTLSSPFFANISDTPKSHILAVCLSIVNRMFSGLIWSRQRGGIISLAVALEEGMRGGRATYISVNDVVLVQVLEAHEDLAKVGSSAEETHRWVGGLGGLGEVEEIGRAHV